MQFDGLTPFIHRDFCAWTTVFLTRTKPPAVLQSGGFVFKWFYLVYSVGSVVVSPAWAPSAAAWAKAAKGSFSGEA